MTELWLKDNQKHTRPTDNRPDKHGWHIAAGYRAAPNLSTAARTKIIDRRTAGHPYIRREKRARKEKKSQKERSKRKRNEDDDDDNDDTERRKQKERKK